MLDYLIKRPFILSAIGCISASVLGFYSKTALLCYLVLVSVWFLYFVFKLKSFNLSAVSLISIICTISVLITINRINEVSKFIDKTENCTFIVNNITFSGDNFYYANCEIIDRKDTLNHSNISVLFSGKQAKSGDILKGELTFSEVEKTYVRNSYSNKIFLSAKAQNVTETGRCDFILSSAEKLRTYISETLFSNIDYTESATLCALLFGDRSYFTDSFYSAIKISGTSHVMVVSGMHLSIIVMIFTFIINKMIYNRYLKAFFIILAVLVMTTLCGFTMSILRAGITYVIMAFAVSIASSISSTNKI